MIIGGSVKHIFYITDALNNFARPHVRDGTCINITDDWLEKEHDE